MSEEQKVLTKGIAVQFLKEKGVSIPKDDEVAAPAGPYNYTSRKNGKTYFLRRRTLKSEGKVDTVLHYFSEQGGPVGDLAGDSQPDEVLNAMPEKYTVGENDDTGLPMLMQKSTEPVDTAKYSSIDEAAAKLLALHWKEGLNLDGLRKISPQVAAILAQSQGVSLRLKSLTTMDDSVAAALAAYKGELYLDGLTELSDAAASAFSDFRGTCFSVWQMSKLSQEAASSLAAIPGELKMSGWPMSTLSPETASALARANRNVWLKNLTALDDQAASALSALHGNLEMDKLESLSECACAALSKHKGTLSLNGVKSLSDAGAAALAPHEGPIFLLSLVDISESGRNALKNALGVGKDVVLSGEALAVMGDVWTLYSKRFTEIEDEVLEEISSQIFSDPPGLDLSGLRTISPDLASTLAAIDGSVHQENRVLLRGLKALSPEAAANLAGCQATLDLSGLEKLPDDVAEALSNHRGCLYLDGLTELTESAAGFLARNKGLLRLNGLESISDATAAALAQCQWPVELKTSLLGASEGCAALKAKMEAGSRFVEIGVKDESVEVYGTTAFKISWDLEWRIIADAGWDEDWANASVMYDFATGRAWKLQIAPELVEKGLAVPYLESDFTVSGPAGISAKGGLANYGEMYQEGGEEVCSDFAPDQETVVDIIRRVHTHALELIALKDTNY